MSADVEFGVDFNQQNISRTHAKRERERESGGGCGEKRGSGRKSAQPTRIQRERSHATHLGLA